MGVVTWDRNFITHSGAVCVPDDSRLRHLLLHEYHDNRSHFGSEEISWGKEWALVDRMVAAAASAAGSAGAAAAAAGTAGTAATAAAGAESEVGGGLKMAPAYLVPWVGGVNPFACLWEMLLGETCYWELSDGRRVGVTPRAGSSAAAPAASDSRAPAGGAGGIRCCAFPGCGRAERPGRPPLKV
ncbi:unnamed protein product [Closterium sp. Naga37s-1]|nr:unnamed protein product [Closterium sp. Naga37s-1]